MNITGFDIQEKIGEGPLTVMFRAHHSALDRTVALRILKQECSSQEEVDIFIGEGRAAAALKHPCVPEIYDISESDGIHFFVLEYIGGKTLAQLLASGHSFSSSQALRITLQVAGALASAWNSANIIHRNVKPGNIRIDDDGLVKLNYLGLSLRPESASGIDSECVVGTPNYMAPEQAQGRALDCRADMYGLGATLYHMVTGQRPFDSCSPQEAAIKQVKGTLPNPRDYVPALSNAMAMLITKLMMKRPENRFTDWDQAIHAMQAIAANKPMVDKTATNSASTIAPPTGRKPMAVRMKSKPRQIAKPRPRMPAAPPDQRPPIQTPSSQTPSTTSPLRRASNARQITARYSQRLSIPLPVRLLAWTALFAWWAFLFYKVHPIQNNPVQTTVEENMPQLRTAPSESTPPTAQTDKPALTAMCTAVANDLMRGEVSNAQRRVQAALRSQPAPDVKPGLNELARLVAQVSALDHLTASSLAQLTGKQTKIRIGDHERMIIPRSIVGTDVTADLVKTGNSDGQYPSVTFSVLEINPRDRAEWLGNADTPAKATMKFLLYMKAGDRTTATLFANKAGLMSEAFLAALQIP